MVTYADRPWTKHYDAGVPASLKPYPEHTVHDYLRRAAQQHADRPALIMTTRLPLVGYREHSLTYAELDRATDAMAAALIALGLQKGGRVALVMPNISAFVIAYYGALKAGGVVSAVNPAYPAEKMQQQIEDCEAEIAVVMSLFYATVDSFRARTRLRHVIVTSIKETLHPLAGFLFGLTQEKKGGYRVEHLAADDYWLPDLLRAHTGQHPEVSVTPEDRALIQYTGGTTGTSKGAVATHRALVVSTEQIGVWTGVALPGVAPKPRHALRVLAALPMFHVYGLVAVLSQAVASGMTIILVPNPRDIGGLVGMIDHYRPEIFLGVPALYSAILNHPEVKARRVRLDSIIISQCGASPMHPSIKADFEAAGGRCLFEGYGMSEIPVGNHSNPLVGVNKPESVGMPLPDVECAIISLDDGETELPVGEVGEIVIHAPHMMQGYYRLPTETANVLRERADGRQWVFTGDIGRMDEDGYFYIVDRKKDLVLIGGLNVYPANVEKVLAQHPAIQQVAVAGIPHPDRIGQEALKAWVVLRPGQHATQADLIAYCEPHLAGYEIPRRYAFVEALPHSAVGKLLRRELVRQEMEDMAGGSGPQAQGR